MKYAFLILLLASPLLAMTQPTISFTFDDGALSNRGGYEFEIWNQMILDALAEAEIKAAFFVKTSKMDSKKGRYLLASWNDKGHMIANHTNSHPNFNRADVSAELFRAELLKADALIRGYSNYAKLFRFPYLKEGNTPAKVDSIRQILAENGYRNGYVTVDASDWYVASRLGKRLRQDPEADLEPFKAFYLEHIFDRAQYYEKLAFDITGRHIKHTLLLHHNLTSALFLDDLIAMFKEKGWKVISADEAFDDPIFKRVPKHAGESLVWALAKDSGNYQLRYPAEDSRYEKDAMDARGL